MAEEDAAPNTSTSSDANATAMKGSSMAGNKDQQKKKKQLILHAFVEMCISTPLRLLAI